MKKIHKTLLILGTVCSLLIVSSSTVWAEEYQYDELNRVTKVTYDDGSYVEYTYDSNGNMVNVNVIPSPGANTGAEDNEGETENSEKTESSEDANIPEETEAPESSEKQQESESSKQEENDEIIENLISAVTDFFNKIVRWLQSIFR